MPLPDPMIGLASCNWFRERVQNPQCDAGRGLRHEVSCENREFVAAKPGNQVAFPNGGGESPGDDRQQFVADPVAIDIVDLLESVEVTSRLGSDLKRCSNCRF
jgi:hypothetical protein